METQEDGPGAYLASCLQQRQPASLLCCSWGPVPAVKEYCEAANCRLQQIRKKDTKAALKGLPRFDMAIIADQLEHMSWSEGEHFLALLQNLHSGHLWVAVSETADGPAWKATDFYALGMHRKRQFSRADGPDITVYTYDIDRYNHIRTWNNPDFWANPENFGKYWW